MGVCHLNDSSLLDTYGHRSRFRHYVLLPPIPFGQIVHCKAKSLPLCQCCLQRVAFADSEGAADLFGDHDASKIVDPADNTGCFHKTLLLSVRIALLVFAENGRICGWSADADLHMTDAPIAGIMKFEKAL